MRFFLNLVMFLMVVLLAACGGGGGSPGLSSGSSTVLFSSAPTTVTLTAGTQVSYPITGGSQPYAVTTDAPALVNASVVDSNLSIAAVSGGLANVFVTDAKGSKLSIAVTIPLKGALFTTAPSAGLTLTVGSSNTFTVGGGTAPYTVVSSNLAIASATITNGTMLTINGHAGGGATIDVRDAVGGMTSVSVTVSSVPTVSMFTTAPSTINIANGATLGYSITGGLPPYTATSDDNGVVRTTVNGSSFSISAVGGGKANVVIKDSQGTGTITIAVNVGSSTKLFINAPSTVTIAAGSSATYLISGGAAPYSVVSSDARVANGGIVGTALTASALASGTANLQITDSAGTVIPLAVTVTSGSAATAVSQDPALKSAALLEGTVATSSIGASTVLSVKLTDPSGLGIPSQVIDVTGDLTQVKFPEGSSGLTNSQGVATIKVDRASLQAAGAGSLTVNYSYKPGAFSAYPNGATPPSAAKVITTYVGYQLSAANVTLANLDVGAGTLAAYGTRQISVQATVNGAVPTGSPVQVNFTTSCGQMTPPSVTTNASGIAVSSYTATDVAGSPISTSGCSGKSVEISASTIGATVVTKSLSVIAAPATNLSFVSATPQRIYLDGSGGPTQSIVEFKLVNARGEPILGQDINLTLKTTNGGIPKASFGAVGNLSPIKGTTDANGKVSVPVFSGTVPTNVLVNAALVANAAIQTDSAALTIASGRPAQARVSMSIGERAIRGFNFDGGETTVTLSLADRQGNPVPDGTAVNFVTEGGVMIPPVCTTGGVAGNSQCTVKIRTQNPRPANGLVTILAYAAGEEDFVDTNANNVYDCGETFTDLGLAYRDDTATNLGQPNAYVAGEFSVPRNASTSNCGAGSSPTPLSGDGVWGAADVREQTVIVFSTDAVEFVNATLSASLATVTIQDANRTRPNSVPTNSKIEVAATDNTDNGVSCTVAGQSVQAVPQSLDPLVFSAALSKCARGDSITIKVTPPAPSSGVWAVTYTIP